MTRFTDAILQSLRTRIIRVFPMQIHSSVEKLTDEQMWWRPNEKSNSIANLILHVSGSLDHYLNFLIGGHPYKRDREAEFAARDTMTKPQLLARLDEMVARGVKTFDGITEARLSGPSSDPEKYDLLVEDLISIATHLSSHTAQIMWIAKMLVEGSLDEVWMKSHKRGGAWK
jgi:uncharacterized damage-inducible protein DinB